MVFIIGDGLLAKMVCCASSSTARLSHLSPSVTLRSVTPALPSRVSET